VKKAQKLFQAIDNLSKEIKAGISTFYYEFIEMHIYFSKNESLSLIGLN